MTNTALSNTFFFNDELKESIFNTISSNSINSLIISGPEGLGKTNFIINLSKFILCELENENSLNLSKLKKSKNTFDNIIKNKSFYLFDNGSHPDFFHLKNTIENLGKKIPIDDVRKLKSFFHKTVSVSKTKVAVINKIEDLTINSLNSLLKTIEELIPIKKMLETAKLEVKDNIAVISSDDFADITINAEDNLVSQNDQVYQFDFAA